MYPCGRRCLLRLRLQKEKLTRGYADSYQNTVDKTKILNDTAVEYINGIEVIKAFAKAQSSYEKMEVTLYPSFSTASRSSSSGMSAPSFTIATPFLKLTLALTCAMLFRAFSMRF